MIAFLVALAIAIAPAAALASGPRTGAGYVALGDSYAAGEGLGPFQGGTDVKKGTHRNQCHRSQTEAYVDLALPVVLPTVTSRAFWACSGATISDLESAPPQRGPGEQYQQPQQTQTVGPTTQWISLSVGGDDLGFGSIGTACGGAEISHLRFQRLPWQPSCTQEIAAQAAKLAGLESNLEGLYNRLLTAAPQAKLVVVGYPRIFPSSYKGLPVYQGKPFCILDHYPVPLTVDVGMPASDARAIDRFEVALNSTIQRATTMATYPADAARIKYADTYHASVPRNCKGTTAHASVAGLVLSPGFNGVGPWYKALIGSGTFHPTGDGQRMMASVVEAAFNSFSTPTTSSWGAPASFDPAGKVASVSCPSASYCAAVDGNGNIMSYNGAAWSTAQTSEDQLKSVSCASDSYCAAVGYNESGGDIFSYNGEAWSPPESLDPGYKLHSISCPTTTFCEVGAAVNVFTVDGTAESGPEAIDQSNNETNESGYGLPSMSCPSATFCATVDGSGNAFTLNGSAWSAPELVDNNVQLDSVSCVSAELCVAVDSAGKAFTYGGSAWSAADAIDANTALKSVSCPSTSFCVAVDANGDALSFSGTAWSAPRSIDSGRELVGVSCPTTRFCMAVDANGNYMVAH